MNAKSKYAYLGQDGVLCPECQMVIGPGDRCPNCGYEPDQEETQDDEKTDQTD